MLDSTGNMRHSLEVKRQFGGNTITGGNKLP